MTHATRFVAVAVLVALALCAPMQAQTPEIDAQRVRAEAGDAGAQNDLALRYDLGRGVPQDDSEAVRWFRLAAEQGSPARRATWEPAHCSPAFQVLSHFPPNLLELVQTRVVNQTDASPVDPGFGRSAWVHFRTVVARGIDANLGTVLRPSSRATLTRSHPIVAALP